MKLPVTNEMVSEYIDRLAKGIPTGELFSQRLSEYDLHDNQRLRINAARNEHRRAQKALRIAISPPDVVPPPAAQSPLPTPSKPVRPKKPSRLQKLLAEQSGLCFYCGQLLKEADANIDHIKPRSQGGTNGYYNTVACHRLQNSEFGAMGVKEKFAHVLKNGGFLKCPKN